MKSIKTCTGLFVLSSVLFVGCAEFIGDLFAPKTCYKCEVVDTWGEVLWSGSECGGGTTDKLMQECREREESKISNGHSSAKCKCESYKRNQ